MKEQTILKIFGTGQITIPKRWRNFFNSDTLKAVFDEASEKISIKPIKMVELEDTQWVSAKKLKQNLAETDFDENFKKELLAGYKKSDFYKSGLKKKK